MGGENSNSSSEQKNNKERDNFEDFYDFIIEKQGAQQIIAEPMNQKDIEELYKNESSMCIIRFEIEKDGNIRNDGLGNGFFCKFDYEGIPFKKALFTNNHILNFFNLKSGRKITFENISNEIIINEERKVFTSEELDYTCIEILDKDKIDKYFEIDSTIIDNKDSLKKNKNKEEIIILQYSPKTRILSFSSGKILDIKGDKIFHSAATFNGSSGSPIIRRSRNDKKFIIGIHFGTIKDKYYGKVATSFDSILKDIKLKIKQFSSDNKLLQI